MLIGVTGAGGFIGSHLVDLLVDRGHKVRAFIRYNSNDSIGNLLPGMCEIIAGDLTDRGLAHYLVDSCDLVYHLAAMISVPASMLAPQATAINNIISTINILRAAALNNTPVITVSSSEVYGTMQGDVQTELHPINPQSSYAASKVACDAFVTAMREELSPHLIATLLRPFNTYGPRQSKRAVIPTIIRKMQIGKAFALQNGDTMRDFTYVSDLCEALYVAGTKEIPSLFSGVHNVCSGESISIQELAYKIARIMNFDRSKILFAEQHRPGQVRSLKGSNKRFRVATGWEPRVPLDEGLKRTVNWCLHNAPGLGDFT